MRAFAGADDPPPVRALRHRNAPPCPGRFCEPVSGDVTDPASLAGLFEGAETVLHLAGAVSEDPAVCMAVNARGTAHVVAAARAAGVLRLIYLSTAAVYGYASHRRAPEDRVTVRPVTPVSRSRAAAERAVLDAGGLVLRPLFTYGTGDTRFIPVLAGALRRLPFLIEDGAAELSVIAVDDLGAALCACTALPAERWRTGAYHATDGHPITVRELAATLAAELGFRAPTRSLPYWLARLVLRAGSSSVVNARAWSSSAAHRLYLIARDHSYDSTRLWSLIGRGPGAPFTMRFHSYAQWYRGYINGGGTA